MYGMSNIRRFLKEHGCKAKVFTKEHGNVKEKREDGAVRFARDVYKYHHKMMNTAVAEAKRKNVRLLGVHSSSASALKTLLAQYV